MYNLSTTMRNALLTTYGTQIGASGKAVVCTVADAELLTITLNGSAALDTPSNGSADFNDPTSGGASWATFSQNPTAAGAASYVSLRTSGGTEVARATVTTIATGTGEFQFTTLDFVTAVPVTTSTTPTLSQAAS